jgi:cation transport ATPase
MCKNVKALNTSMIFTALLVMFMTIFSELNSGFKVFLKELTGHHWVTKSLFTFIFFFLFYFLLKNSKSKLKVEDLKTSFVMVKLSTFAILFFYLWHYFV